MREEEREMGKREGRGGGKEKTKGDAGWAPSKRVWGRYGNYDTSIHYITPFNDHSMTHIVSDILHIFGLSLPVHTHAKHFSGCGG